MGWVLTGKRHVKKSLSCDIQSFGGSKGINIRNISHDKSVFILQRGFEHTVELRRRTEAGKDLIKGRFYTAIMPRDPMQTPYQLSRS